MHHSFQSKQSLLPSVKKNQRKKAYSLLEVTVSLGVVAVATVIMINFLVLSLRISLITLGRSFVREEISNISLVISRDIRNASSIIDCGTMSSNTCTFEQTSGVYRWYLCDTTRVCKDKVVGGVGQNIYKSSSSISINYFNFVTGYAQNNNNERITIIMTISASHTNESLDVDNVIRQTTISTRNYEV
jgi:type II secretory pathway pseudopilin PulG